MERDVTFTAEDCPMKALRTKPTKRAAGLISCLPIVLFATMVHPQSALADEVGKRLYLNFCATCHGELGNGDGKGVMPGPRLTDLAERNGGTYPFDQVVSVIDGSEESGAHGSPMPSWGNKFGQLFGYGPDETKDEGDAWIRSLARYVGDLQN
jgi:mono/diheme cytochrome c family protein